MRTSFIATILFFFIFIATAPVIAANVVLLDINIAGLENLDLGTFDLDVAFDDGVYEFHDYFLTDALGSISFGDAEDWSYGLDDDTGSVNIAVLSYLTDLTYQPSEFTLTTLVFSRNDDVTLLDNVSSEFGVTVNALVDAFGDAIPFTVSGTEISAIPVPAAVLLLGSGLIGLVAIRRR